MADLEIIWDTPKREKVDHILKRLPASLQDRLMLAFVNDDTITFVVRIDRELESVYWMARAAGFPDENISFELPLDYYLDCHEETEETSPVTA